MIGNSILQTIGTDSSALISYGEFLVNINDAFSVRQGFESAQRKAKNSENDQCLSRLTGFIYAVTEAPESFDNATVDRVTKIMNCETPGRVHPYRPTTAALAALARLLRDNPGIYGIPNSILVKLERQSEIAAEIVRQDTERQKRIDSSLKISNLLDGSGPTSEAKVQAPVPQQAPLFKSQFADRGVNLSLASLQKATGMRTAMRMTHVKRLQIFVTGIGNYSRPSLAYQSSLKH
jgi:hypothetical protein